jgi:hypothetical protein
VGGDRIWTDVLPDHVISLAGSRAFAAVGLADGSLLLYTNRGRRALPPVDLGAPPVLMAAKGDGALLVLTADGQFVAWDTMTVGIGAGLAGFRVG